MTQTKETKTSSSKKEEEVVETKPNPKVKERAKELKKKMDEVVDDIDAILEEATLATEFKQAGGE